MAAEIKLTKADESPWGFRLTGGRDFGTPLTILKVAINSVAEQAGLKVGDILVRINNESGHALTHRDAQEVIRKSGNTITFSVLRGSLNLPEEVIERLTPLPLQEFISQTPDPNSQAQQDQNQQNQQLSGTENRIPAVDPNIQIIPIKDLEPEQLAELGLKPLPSDFLEKALRDPSPLPEVRPQLNATPVPDVLEALDQLGLQDVVQNIEKQKEVDNAQAAAAAQAQAQEQAAVPTQVQETQKENVEGQTAQEVANAQQEVSPAEQTQEAQAQPPQEQLPQEPVPPPEFIANQPLTEETFAEIMSGKAGVIDGSAIGVDFKKFEPQTNFLKKSQVFQTLQEEQQQGEKKKEKEKRWTTFLEKPDRPKPKPKPKTPKTQQNKGETPKAQEADATPTPTPTPEPPNQLYEIPSQEEFEALVKVPEPASEPQQEGQQEPAAQGQEGESQPEGQTQAEEQIQETCQEKQPEETTAEEQQLVKQQQVLEKQLSTEITVEEKSDIELQLEEIQKQLEAIRQLPFEIQQHLSMVQDQLTKIVQHRTQEQTEAKIPAAPRPSIAEPEPIEPPKQEETLEETPENPAGEQQAEQAEEIELSQEPESQPESQPQEQQPQDEKQEFKLKPEEEEAILPPPKKEKPKKKRPFMGLGPAPRPLILPGGRKWRTPKDAYNDEFIAETLSAQAEIITGTTLGVNFRKYEPKHVSLDHLRDSIVYKMIHDLEDPDVLRRGLADRPEIVPALQDYVQPATPAAI